MVCTFSTYIAYVHVHCCLVHTTHTHTHTHMHCAPDLFSILLTPDVLAHIATQDHHIHPNLPSGPTHPMLSVSTPCHTSLQVDQLLGPFKAPGKLEPVKSVDVFKTGRPPTLTHKGAVEMARPLTGGGRGGRGELSVQGVKLQTECSDLRWEGGGSVHVLHSRRHTACAGVFICTYVHTYVLALCTYKCACVCVFVYACVCVCVYACVCVCVAVYCTYSM